MAEWEIRRGLENDLDALAPLWIAVHHQHVESMPELAPYVTDDESWAERRSLYAELLAKPDTLLLLVFEGENLIGYGLAHVMPLGVLPGDRSGSPIGSTHASRPQKMTAIFEIASPSAVSTDC